MKREFIRSIWEGSSFIELSFFLYLQSTHNTVSKHRRSSNMPMTKPKRAKMEKLIYDTFDKLDPTGANVTKYRNLFKSMSDPQFDIFFKKLFASEIDFLTLDVIDYEIDLRLEHVEAAAKVLNVPLTEHVALPHVNKDKDNPIMTKQDVIVGYLHIKRMQQMLSKKNTTSTDVGERSALTGQVTGKDKNARDSDSENFALVTLDAEQTLKEFLGPRADDRVMKAEMYADISRKGYATLAGLTNDVNNKATLSAVDAYLIGMGIKSDLITDNLLLRKSTDE